MNPMRQVGNINELNIENLFRMESCVSGLGSESRSTECSDFSKPKEFKLTYNNYTAVTQDFRTHCIDEEALRALEGFGYPRQMVI